MNPSGVSVPEPILVGVAAVTLIEAAARDLEDFSEKIMAPGHWPSWTYPQVPDGLALCVGCWRPIMALQVGVKPCPGARRERLAESLEVTTSDRSATRGRPTWAAAWFIQGTLNRDGVRRLFGDLFGVGLDERAGFIERLGDRHPPAGA